jgi:hypothetical protein
MFMTIITKNIQNKNTLEMNWLAKAPPFSKAALGEIGSFELNSGPPCLTIATTTTVRTVTNKSMMMALARNKYLLMRGPNRPTDNVTNHVAKKQILVCEVITKFDGNTLLIFSKPTPQERNILSNSKPAFQVNTPYIMEATNALKRPTTIEP